MSEDPESRSPAGVDQLLEEASLWFARMRSPDAENFRAEFEKWLALGAAHRGAYNRAGEVFAMGRFLAQEKRISAENISSTAFRRAAPRHWAMAAGIVLAIGAGSWVLLSQRNIGSTSSQPQIASANAEAAITRETISAAGAARRIARLSDGSIVTLDADSVLKTAFSTSSRNLDLERGHVRFDVAHEARPFVVRAGSGSVTARGTIFDVRLSSRGEVTVRLLRGAVDVERPPSQGTDALAVTRLGVGEMLSFGLAKPNGPGDPTASDVTPFSDMSDLTTIREFDRAPLSSVLEAANKDSVMQIRLADPSIATLKVSGRFRIDDAEQVAERLAALFDLRVEHSGANSITLRSAKQS